MSSPTSKICMAKACNHCHQLEGTEKKAFKWGKTNCKVHHVALKKLNEVNEAGHKKLEKEEHSHEWYEAKMKREKAAKKAEGKKCHQEQVKGILKHKAKKVKKQVGNEQGVGDLFHSHMHMMIQDIEEAVMLSGWANLLTAEVNTDTADQKMTDFNAQIDLAHHEELPPPGEVPEDKFKVILTLDEEEEEDEEDEEEWIVKDGEEEEEEDKEEDEEEDEEEE
ncbi:hypothetical protein FQN50_006752 [Emmonsiellopsis sp. PD_5]|nr:hypothetical protein FQN50_006752 [Emmonsiellopsis sp. PD_5]